MLTFVDNVLTLTTAHLCRLTMWTTNGHNKQKPIFGKGTINHDDNRHRGGILPREILPHSIAQELREPCKCLTGKGSPMDRGNQIREKIAETKNEYSPLLVKVAGTHDVSTVMLSEAWSRYFLLILKVKTLEVTTISKYDVVSTDEYPEMIVPSSDGK
jgi:hypothetical protein